MVTTTDPRGDLDVIVVGAGNAATCAALSAQENGGRVLMLEIAPEEARGGNRSPSGDRLFRPLGRSGNRVGSRNATCCSISVVRWTRSAPGAFRVLRTGGRLEHVGN